MSRFTTITLAPALDRTIHLTGSLAKDSVCRVASETVEAGGKGLNVAKMLSRLGAPVAASGLLGDANYEPFERMLHEFGIDNRFLRVHGETRRNLMLLGTDGLERKINFPAFPELDFADYLLRQISLLSVRRADVIILSGSLPARFPASTYATLVRLLREQQKDVVLDTSGEALALASAEQPLLIKPNREEAESLLGRRLVTEADFRGGCRELLRRHKAVIVSDGEAGAWFAKGTALFHAVAPRVDAVDTTAAGDMMLGAFCSRFFPDKTLDEETVAFAVAAGSAAVELPASRVPDVARIEELARQVRIEK